MQSNFSNNPGNERVSADGKTLIGYDVDLLNDLQELLGFEIDGGFQAMDYSALTTSLAEMCIRDRYRRDRCEIESRKV